jgi:Domain of unknown function (DUF4402)
MLAWIQRAGNPSRKAGLAALLGLSLSPGAALAAPGDSATGTGTAEASVIERFQIVNDDSLRFGTFTRPSSAGTLSIAVNGTVTGTAGMTTTYSVPQSGAGRGPASFHLNGTRNRLVQVSLPGSFNITNAQGVTMSVDQLVRNASNNGNQDVRLSNTGYFLLLVGGRLNVAANQAGGTYLGNFDVTVTYQ